MERPKCWRPSPKLTPFCAFDPLSRTGRVRGLTFADGGYGGPKLRGAIEKIGRWTIQIVKRSDTAIGFELIPRRWVVERTFAWLGRCRRMAKDRGENQRQRRSMAAHRPHPTRHPHARKTMTSFIEFRIRL